MSRRRMRRFPEGRPLAERRFERTFDFFRKLDRIGGPRRLVPIAWLARLAPTRGGLAAIHAAGVAVVGDRVRIPRIWLRAVISLRGAQKKTPRKGFRRALGINPNGKKESHEI